MNNIEKYKNKIKFLFFVDIKIPKNTIVCQNET